MSTFALGLVQQLHRPRRYEGGTLCAECRQVYPCETVNVIAGALELQAPAPAPASAPEAPTGRTPRAPAPSKKRKR